MNYERIIIEMLQRIQALEDRVAALEADRPVEAPAPAPAAPVRGISAAAVDACYDLALRLEQSPAEDAAQALHRLADSHGCQYNYAVCFVTAARAMLAGREFKYAIKRDAARRFFDRILEDFGRQGLRRAIDAARAHAAYQQRHGNPARSICSLCDAYESRAL